DRAERRLTIQSPLRLLSYRWFFLSHKYFPPPGSQPGGNGKLMGVVAKTGFMSLAAAFFAFSNLSVFFADSARASKYSSITLIAITIAPLIFLWPSMTAAS